MVHRRNVQNLSLSSSPPFSKLAQWVCWAGINISPATPWEETKRRKRLQNLTMSTSSFYPSSFPFLSAPLSKLTNAPNDQQPLWQQHQGHTLDWTRSTPLCRKFPPSPARYIISLSEIAPLTIAIYFQLLLIVVEFIISSECTNPGKHAVNVSWHLVL